MEQIMLCPKNKFKILREMLETRRKAKEMRLFLAWRRESKTPFLEGLALNISGHKSGGGEIGLSWG